MARKRKTRATVAEPEPVQPIVPEPDPEQPEPGETHQPLENEEPVGGEERDLGAVSEEKAIEAEAGEEEEANVAEAGEDEEAIGAEAGEDEDAIGAEQEQVVEDVEEPENEAVAEANEQENEVTDKPSENAGVQENGGLGQNEKGEEEEEDELEEDPLEKLLEPFTKDQLTVLIKDAVAKHPDFMENVNKVADANPSHRKIFIHGLGWEATVETITTVFAKYGEIEDCRVVKDKISGKSKGYGFILFKHRKGARHALKEPQKLIQGRMTSCQLASAGPVQAPSPTVVTTAPSPPVSEITLRKIFVSNVSAELDMNKLVEFFTKFGEIEEGPLGLDKQTGKPRGFCLFVYKSVKSAKKALEEPHKSFEGQILHCQQAVDGPKHSKGDSFPQHGQQHHHQGQQGHYRNTAKRGRYSGSTGGHLMAPSNRPAFNHAVAPAAIGQAFAALLAQSGGGYGGVNLQGVPPIMNNAGYGGQAGGGGYGVQQGFQGSYGGQPQMGQGGVRPYQGGAPYMGPGH